MPGLYKDEAIVLRSIKLGEADRIVTLFARDAGKISAVAKGIRKTKSKFGGRLEPFTCVELVLYRGRNLDTVTQVDIVSSFQEVRADYARLTAASALVELVDKISPDREQALSVYRLLLAGLSGLAEGKGATVVPGFVLKMLSLSGFHPQLSVCAGCGRRDGLGGFSAGLGGVVCEDCWREDRDAERVAPATIELMARLLHEDFGVDAGERATGEVTQLLRHYAEYHIERPLRSLSLLPAS